MAVNVAALQSTLASNFANPGSSFADCAQQWADAMVSYASTVVPPSTTVAVAGQALRTSLAGAFATAGGALPLMDPAFMTFATSVGAGMAGAGFVGAPPPLPIGFASLAGTFSPSHDAAAAVVAGKIQAWFVTGTATPVVGGPPVPWT
jgi:hypothetical protein